MRVVGYDVPLRTRFRGLDRRDGLLLQGDAGWAEFSPFWDYDAAESAAWLAAAREAADLAYPEPVRDRVPVNVTVPAVGPERAHAIVTGSGGCTTAKIKVAETGQTLDEEIARVEAVRDALGPGGKVRVDVNARWDLDTALHRLPLLDRAAGGLEYAEQPCAAVEDLAALRRRLDVPIAADESIRRAADPFRVRDAQAADVVVLKVQPLGGVRACLHLAERIGLPVVVSSALESSIGLAAGVALAAALPELHHACGLATAHLLERDTVADPLLPVDGHLPVTRPEPDPAALDAAAQDPDLAARWERRLAEVTAALDARGGRAMTDPAAQDARPAARPDPSAAPGAPGPDDTLAPDAGPAGVPDAQRTAQEILAALVAHGVRDVVLAPGSRSAPLAYAARAAEEAGWLRLHVRVDERVAGFVALGLGLAGRPAAAVTTSGTAVANLHPAVLEAAHARVPLFVLSADRPHEIRGTGANQTTDQVGIFAGAPVFAAEIPAGAPGGAKLGQVIARAVAAATGARGGPAGPAHLNVAFREPLVPAAPWAPGPAPARATLVTPHGRPAPVRLPAGERTVVVAGDDGREAADDLGISAGARALDRADDAWRTGGRHAPTRSAAARLARAGGWPLLAEPSSGARTDGAAVPAYRLLLDLPGLGAEIRRVVVLGHPTLSRPVSQLLAREDVEVVVVDPAGAWTDVSGTAARVADATEIDGTPSTRDRA